MKPSPEDVAKGLRDQADVLLRAAEVLDPAKPRRRKPGPKPGSKRKRKSEAPKRERAFPEAADATGQGDKEPEGEIKLEGEH